MRRPRSTGSAHTGTMEWLVQRVSALYLSGFVIYLTASFSYAPLQEFAAWKAWFSLGGVRLAWALFFISLLSHTWIGLRSIYMDYLQPLWLRFSLTLLTGVGLLALALWATQILLQVGS
ncbi:MAG: succinate dehydrogenase, hydrophobic membrane anchor protein [Gammaproteobacteria bacterium]|nr:MAG: succinate dehydrogenase, hydrophobic membrane anchor protein [Gammaproteobacteria bacterium]